MSPWAAIEAISPGERVIVASDFDGTLAPLVDDPGASELDPVAGPALLRLAGLPGVTVAIVSGRARPQLIGFFPPGSPFLFIGEHGNDSGPGGDTAATVPPEMADRLRSSAQELPGSWVEEKGHSVAIHYRKADPAEAERVVAPLTMWAEGLDHVTVMSGKKILEISTGSRNKGDAVESLRQDLSPDRVIFLGDDVTDETVFIRLLPGDIGIKVGPGESAAGFRVAGIGDVGPILVELGRRLGG